MTRRTLVPAAVLALALAGCGGDDAPDESPSPSPTAAVSPSPAPEPTEDAQAAPDKQAQTRTYEVKDGDTLSAIAQRFDTTVKELVRLNKIKDKHAIKSGQELKVPAGN